MKAVTLATALVCLPTQVLAAGAEPGPHGMLAAPGYTAAINTPTADVLRWGEAAFALSNSNPEYSRTIPIGSFGSLNGGVGLLPGLELVGRLSFQGDLRCNQFAPGCWSTSRDLSISGKYQLPVKLPFGSRLAFGFSDYGGAVTFYRQVYGVATSTLGPLDLSLGYGKPKTPAALLDGPFGSMAVSLSERWRAALEHDTRATRLGVVYTQPLTEDLSLQLGASRKLNEVAGQQPWQMNAQLSWALGRRLEAPMALSPRINRETFEQSLQLPPVTVAHAPAAMPTQPALPATIQPIEMPSQPMATQTLARELETAGFGSVVVRWLPASPGKPALWQVQAEPRRWRQSQLDALGAALAVWRRQVADQASDELALTLTYQRKPVLGAYTSAWCLQAWVDGQETCGLNIDEQEQTLAAELQDGRTLRLYRLADWPAALAARLADATAVVEATAGAPAWMPQFELAPNLRNTLGTEYGLFDYSLALDLGFEAGLAPGLSVQGVMSTPVAHSDDFADRKVFGDRRHPEAGLDSAFLAYWQPLPWGMSVQGAVGQLSRHENGGQVDVTWMSPDGRWRLAGVGGQYASDLDKRLRQPMLGALRYSVLPGAWHVDVMAGRFMGGDEGYKLMSSHWLGDMRFSLYYRRSETPQAWALPQRSFMGFELSLPLGPKAAQSAGPVTVRGRDRWGWGIESKVGEKDNNLTQGYGLIPRLRHGLTSDVSDHDRNGLRDLQAQLPRLRAMLR